MKGKGGRPAIPGRKLATYSLDEKLIAQIKERRLKTGIPASAQVAHALDIYFRHTKKYEHLVFTAGAKNSPETKSDMKGASGKPNHANKPTKA